MNSRPALMIAGGLLVLAAVATTAILLTNKERDAGIEPSEGRPADHAAPRTTAESRPAGRAAESIASKSVDEDDPSDPLFAKPTSAPDPESFVSRIGEEFYTTSGRTATEVLAPFLSIRETRGVLAKNDGDPLHAKPTELHKWDPRVLDAIIDEQIEAMRRALDGIGKTAPPPSSSADSVWGVFSDRRRAGIRLIVKLSRRHATIVAALADSRPMSEARRQELKHLRDGLVASITEVVETLHTRIKEFEGDLAPGVTPPPERR